MLQKPAPSRCDPIFHIVAISSRAGLSGSQVGPSVIRAKSHEPNFLPVKKRWRAIMPNDDPGASGTCTCQHYCCSYPTSYTRNKHQASTVELECL